MKNNRIKKVFYYAFTICVMLFVGSNNVLAADTTATSYVQCGDNTFPAPVATIIRTVILLLQIVIPIGIVIMGSLDFLKATIAGDTDKMKKNQKQFVSRLIAGAIAFFVFVVVKFVVSMVADSNNSASFTSCLDCLINDEGSCDTVAESPFDLRTDKEKNAS